MAKILLITGLLLLGTALLGCISHENGHSIDGYVQTSFNQTNWLIQNQFPPNCHPQIGCYATKWKYPDFVFSQEKIEYVLCSTQNRSAPCEHTGVFMGAEIKVNQTFAICDGALGSSLGGLFCRPKIETKTFHLQNLTTIQEARKLWTEKQITEYWKQNG